jgi:hypothetical protein
MLVQIKLLCFNGCCTQTEVGKLRNFAKLLRHNTIKGCRPLVLDTTPCRLNGVYRYFGRTTLPYFLLSFSRLVSSLGIVSRYTDDLHTMFYCVQQYVILSTKACVFTGVQNLVVNKLIRSPMLLGRAFSQETIIFVVSHAESLPCFFCCFVFQML